MTVFALQMLVPINSVANKVCQMLVDFIDFIFEHHDVIVRLFAVELNDSLNLNFQQACNIVVGYFPDKVWLKRSQSLVNMLDGRFFVLTLLIFFVLINSFFNEDFFERSKEQTLKVFAFLNFQFLAQQVFCSVNAVA